MSVGEEYSNTLVVAVDGAPLAPDVAALLTSGYVDDSRNVPDLFVLRFSDDHSTVLTKTSLKIGAKVTLAVQSSGPGGPVPLLAGEVTALEREVGNDGLHTIVRGLDHSHRLFHGSRVEAYLQSTASDIVRKVAQRAGIKPGTIDADGPVLNHVAQDGVSDWEFLRRLARESGTELRVTDGALHFTASTDAATGPGGQSGARGDPLVIERGVNLVSLRATVTSGGQVPDVEVRGWDPESKRPVVSVASVKARSARLPDITPAGLADTFQSNRYVAAPTTFDQAAQADASAAAVASRLAGAFVELDGVVRGNPKLRSGAAIALTGVGAPFEGRYTLSSSRHDFSSTNGYLTFFTVSDTSERSLYGVVAGPGHATPAPGVMNAVVTATKDPEDRGRVKVMFPAVSDDYESWWARTVQAGAGPGRGSVLLPEVGDEVLVAFGLGSFQQPYVLGGLFNGQDKPDKPWTEHIGGTDGAVTRRAYASRSGMLVEFLESPDGEQLNISTNGGAQRVSLVQKRDSAIEIVSEGPVTVTAKTDVTVTTASGNVSITGTNVTMEAKSALELKGANVSVVGRTTAELKAPTAKVTADVAAELSAGATTTITGGIVRIN